MILRLLCIWLVFYSLLSLLMHGTLNLKYIWEPFLLQNILGCLPSIHSRWMTYLFELRAITGCLLTCKNIIALRRIMYLVQKIQFRNRQSSTVTVNYTLGTVLEIKQNSGMHELKIILILHI
jgi:hypothetical protein